MHAERSEDPLGGELAEGAPGDAVHQGRREHVSGVGVAERRAGEEVEGREAGDELERLILGDPGQRPSGDRGEGEPFTEAAGVLQALRDRHGGLEAQLRQVRADVVVEADETVSGEKKHRGGRELLAHRGDVEAGALIDRHTELDRGQSRRRLGHQHAASIDPHCQSRTGG